MSTIVFVHAHPDDEALLTGGTMAQLAARGHRVVLVTATDGAAGLTSSVYGGPDRLAVTRRREVEHAAAALGCARTVALGFRDSGSAGPLEPDAFAALPVDVPAERLAAVLTEEAAHLVVGYDPAGGYGHRDHRQVHRVTRRAAELAGTPRMLEATVDRRQLQRALRLVRPLTRGAPDFRPERFDSLFAAPADITHRIDVRRQVAAKRAAFAGHASQASSDGDVRSLQRFLALPRPLFGLLFGQEWFTELGGRVPRRRITDVLRPAR